MSHDDSPLIVHGPKRGIAMMQAVEGVVRNGKVEVVDLPPEAEGSRVVVTILPKGKGIDLRERGISEAEATVMRAQFEAIAED